MKGFRLPKETDVPAMIRMSLSFKAASPYADHSTDPEKVEHVVREFLNAGTDKICVLAVDDADQPFGMVAGQSTEFMWNKEYHAGELVWWVDHDKRRSAAGVRLHEAFETWAAHIGCTHVHMAHLEDGTPQAKRLSEYYAKKGYVLTESNFVKRIR